MELKDLPASCAIARKLETGRNAERKDILIT
jgi:hypothetical protein